MGEGADAPEARSSTGISGRIRGGWMERRSRVLPREIWRYCLAASPTERRDDGRQKSAEVVVAGHPGEGLNIGGGSFEKFETGISSCNCG
jgi:hypothetical protein